VGAKQLRRLQNTYSRNGTDWYLYEYACRSQPSEQRLRLALAKAGEVQRRNSNPLLRPDSHTIQASANVIRMSVGRKKDCVFALNFRQALARLTGSRCSLWLASTRVFIQIPIRAIP